MHFKHHHPLPGGVFFNNLRFVSPCLFSPPVTPVTCAFTSAIFSIYFSNTTSTLRDASVSLRLRLHLSLSSPVSTKVIIRQSEIPFNATPIHQNCRCIVQILFWTTTFFWSTSFSPKLAQSRLESSWVGYCCMRPDTFAHQVGRWWGMTAIACPYFFPLPFPFIPVDVPFPLSMKLCIYVYEHRFFCLPLPLFLLLPYSVFFLASLR